MRILLKMIEKFEDCQDFTRLVGQSSNKYVATINQINMNINKNRKGAHIFGIFYVYLISC